MTGAPPTAGSFPLADRLARYGIPYGWVVAAVTSLTMVVGACAVGAPGVLIGPLQAEFGCDVADISAAFAVRLALYGLVGPFAAYGAGFMRSAYATCMPAFHVAGLLCLIAAFTIFAIRTSRIRPMPATA